MIEVNKDGRNKNQKGGKGLNGVRYLWSEEQQHTLPLQGQYREGTQHIHLAEDEADNRVCSSQELNIGIQSHRSADMEVDQGKGSVEPVKQGNRRVDSNGLETPQNRHIAKQRIEQSTTGPRITMNSDNSTSNEGEYSWSEMDSSKEDASLREVQAK